MRYNIKSLKREIVEKLGKLPKKDVKELHDFATFLQMKSFLPHIDLRCIETKPK